MHMILSRYNATEIIDTIKEMGIITKVIARILISFTSIMNFMKLKLLHFVIPNNNSRNMT